MFVLHNGFVWLVVALSLLSGAGSFMQGRREKRLKGVVDLIAEMILAVIVGLAVGYVGESQSIDKNITCALVLVLSNNGSDTLTFLKKSVVERLAGLLTTGGLNK